MLQSTGQETVLHSADLVREGQAEPAALGLVTMVRVAVLEPVPQVLEQVDHALNLVTAQLMAQIWVLQARDAFTAGHLSPPLAGSTITLRRRFCSPPPHTLVQVLQADQGVTWQ